jgi:hypothetical protein
MPVAVDASCAPVRRQQRGQLVGRHPQSSRDFARSVIDIDQATRLLASMRDDGVLTMTGSRRTARYHLDDVSIRPGDGL